MFGNTVIIDYLRYRIFAKDIFYIKRDERDDKKSSLFRIIKVGGKLMLYYDELKEAIDRGYIKGDTVQIVRKNGIVFDYVLPNEPIKPYEVVTTEKVADVLEELKEW